jgi:hypothetical protein
MTDLRIMPLYRHGHESMAPKTNLNSITAYYAYIRLRQFLALEESIQVPAAGWDEECRDLFKPNGYHHAIRWMSIIKKGWRRLKYDEFLAWYGIAPFDKRQRS